MFVFRKSFSPQTCFNLVVSRVCFLCHKRIQQLVQEKQRYKLISVKGTGQTGSCSTNTSVVHHHYLHHWENLLKSFNYKTQIFVQRSTLRWVQLFFYIFKQTKKALMFFCTANHKFLYLYSNTLMILDATSPNIAQIL